MFTKLKAEWDDLVSGADLRSWESAMIGKILEGVAALQTRLEAAEAALNIKPVAVPAPAPAPIVEPAVVTEPAPEALEPPAAA